MIADLANRLEQFHEVLLAHGARHAIESLKKDCLVMDIAANLPRQRHSGSPARRMPSSHLAKSSTRLIGKS